MNLIRTEISWKMTSTIENASRDDLWDGLEQILGTKVGSIESIRSSKFLLVNKKIF